MIQAIVTMARYATARRAERMVCMTSFVMLTFNPAEAPADAATAQHDQVA